MSGYPGGLGPVPGRRDSLAPAFLAALALHLALLAAVIWLHGARPLPLGDVTPITIVAHGPVTDSRPAEAAPQVQAAQAEQPAPAQTAPPPLPAPPIPAPRPPAPPKPQPVQKPVPIPAPSPKARPIPAKPTPAKAAPPTPAKDTFLERLAQSLPQSAPSSRRPPGPARGARGPVRPETAPQPRVDAGQGVSQSDLQGLQQLLERLWNPNCAAPGGDQAVIPVRFSIDADGRVAGRVVEHGEDSAAARRAIDAVHQAEPYAAAYRNNTFTVNFDARKACAGREE